MAEQDSSQERTEQATPKRQKEAREQGQVPRSRELNTMLVLVAGSASLLIMGDGLIRQIMSLMQRSLTIDRLVLSDIHALPQVLAGTVLDALLILGPLFGVLFIAVLLAPALMGGWSFSVKALGFKWSKLDPIKGLGRIFAWRGLMELGKTLAKFVLLAGVSGIVIWQFFGELLALGSEPLLQGLSHAGKLLTWTFLGLSTVLVIIALIDVPFQLWEHHRQLKMTRQEIKDESKETEGRPEVKQRIRNLQREMAQRRMMEEVPKADVIIVNPTHFAVGLKFGERMSAPKVIAKGGDLVAARIRELAEQNGVLVFTAPPLARALFHSAELDQEIPSDLYVAVAQVLAYVYQLRNVTVPGKPRPRPPADLPVPDGYTHDK
ncbi:MAG: flagellar biosynthesis protein FlhB [Pseudomonadota bacterium]